MALLTISEVQDEATERDVDVSSYSDSSITRKIAKSQAYIETETGRNFDTTTITSEQHLQNVGNTIILDNSPVTSVTKIMIDDSEYSLDDIEIDYKVGIVYLTKPGYNELVFNPLPPFNMNLPYDALVDYITVEDVTGKMYVLIQDVCLDLFFINLDKSNDGQSIKSFNDGSLSVSYDSDDPMDNINKRLKPFKKYADGMI